MFHKEHLEADVFFYCFKRHASQGLTSISEKLLPRQLMGVIYKTSNYVAVWDLYIYIYISHIVFSHSYFRLLPQQKLIWPYKRLWLKHFQLTNFANWSCHKALCEPQNRQRVGRGMPYSYFVQLRRAVTHFQLWSKSISFAAIHTWFELDRVDGWLKGACFPRRLLNVHIYFYPI